MKSGVNGISWYLKKGRKVGCWRVTINIKGERKYLGCFKDLEDAKEIREKYSKKYSYVDYMPNKDELNQEWLKKLVTYNSETGEFYWNVTYTGVVQKGRRIIGKSINSSSGKQYKHVIIGNHRYGLHRLAFLYMVGYIPEQVDHMNGNGCDNRWINLRSANSLINNRNHRVNKRNKTGIIGVRWDSSRNKFCVTIGIGGKNKTLGRYKDFFEACCKRKSAEVKYGYHKNHGTNRPL